MSKITNKVALAALAIFTDHKNIDKIFMTSDGQGFTEEEKAIDNARYHKDKSITPFERGFEESYQEVEETTEQKKGDDPDEREALIAEYKKLFGKPAHHQIGVAKLKDAIAVKKTELAEAARKGNLPIVEDVKTETSTDAVKQKDEETDKDKNNVSESVKD